MDSWLPPYAGETIDDWTVVATDRSSHADKHVSILMDSKRELYRVALFVHGRDWSKMLAPKDFTSFTVAVREYEELLG